MRICLYSKVFPPAIGGMERFAENLAEARAMVAARQAGTLLLDPTTINIVASDTTPPNTVTR